jgi:hypothetical protein
MLNISQPYRAPRPVTGIALLYFIHFICVTCISYVYFSFDRQRELFQVLKAYSILNSSVGYCQAQAPLAAFLLMHMPSEQAFWCLVSICDKYLVGYYSQGMVSPPGGIVLCSIKICIFTLNLSVIMSKLCIIPVFVIDIEAYFMHDVWECIWSVLRPNFTY